MRTATSIPFFLQTAIYQCEVIVVMIAHSRAARKASVHSAAEISLARWQQPTKHTYLKIPSPQPTSATRSRCRPRAIQILHLDALLTRSALTRNPRQDGVASAHRHVTLVSEVAVARQVQQHTRRSDIPLVAQLSRREIASCLAKQTVQLGFWPVSILHSRASNLISRLRHIRCCLYIPGQSHLLVRSVRYVQAIYLTLRRDRQHGCDPASTQPNSKY